MTWDHEYSQTDEDIKKSQLFLQCMQAQECEICLIEAFQIKSRQD